MGSSPHPVLRYAVLFSTGLMLLFAIALLYYYHQQQEGFVHQHQKIAERSVRDVRKQIQLYIEKQRRTVSLFGNAHALELAQLPNLKPNEPWKTLLWPRLVNIEPSAQNFTLADHRGDILLDDPQKIVGRGCRNDVTFFAEFNYPNKLFIHTNDVIGDHIDIITRVKSQAGKPAHLFFVSLSLSELTDIITRGEAEQHQLVLVDEQNNLQLSAEGRPAEPINLRDMPGSTLYQATIPGTRWQLVDMIPATLYKDHAQALQSTSLVIFFLLSALGLPLLWLIFREERGRRLAETRLIDSHQMLEALLEKRTNALLESKQDLDYLAQHDLLTGLLNRSTFTQQVCQLMEQGVSHQNHVIAYIDLDDFNLINETAGHHAGDRVLEALTDLLKRTMPENGLAARLGGDLFALALPEQNADDALPFLQSLQENIHMLKGDHLPAGGRVSVSIGLTETSASKSSIHGFLTEADIALHQAKEHGKGHICLFDTLEEDIENRSRLLQHSINVESALQQDRLTLFQQEIRAISADAEAEPRIEILVRMYDFENNVISPADFIPAAEQFGQMPDLDYWVTEHAVQWMESQEHCPYVHINLSGQTLTSKQSFNRFLNLLKNSTHHALRHLCFEITETTAVQDFAQALHFIQAAKALGVSFALDDYGSGVCSFSYLRTLPVDILKIDGDLITSMSGDSVNSAMVESIVSMAKALDLSCVAEFIEDEVCLKQLQQMGVEYGQGYLFHKPTPLET